MRIEHHDSIRVIDMRRNLEARFTVEELYNICIQTLEQGGTLGNTIAVNDVPKVIFASWLPQIEKVEFYLGDNSLVGIIKDAFDLPDDSRVRATDVYLNDTRKVRLFPCFENALRKAVIEKQNK